MIGKLRHRVQIQKNYPTRTAGVRTDDWRTLETVYARIEPLRGAEGSTASQKESVQESRITMRYRPNVGALSDILARYRIEYGSRLFDIRDIQQLYPHDEFTVLRVEEVIT